MQIVKNKVAQIDYTLSDDDGDVIDTSAGGEPLSYLHGSGMIIPGLEAALAGKSAGDELEVVVEPSQGYGERDPELLHTANRSQFPGSVELAVGMRFQTSREGSGAAVTVIAIDGDEVTLDGNHPLAGVRLHFALKIVSVRDATAEEIKHGHPHDGGHHHH